jgi:hypothetical protein
MKSSLLLSLVLILALTPSLWAQPMYDPTDLDADGHPGTATPPAGAATEPEVFALSGAANLLIDRSHEEDFDVSGFTSFLESQGWTVDEFSTGPISEAVLAQYSVLMVPVRLLYSIVPFSPEEVSAITNFVSSGGGLWVFNENQRDPTGVNSLANAFGVSFFSDLVFDPSNNEGQTFWPTIHLLQPHPIMDGVSSYGYYAGCCLSPGAPSAVVSTGDDDAYSSSCPLLPPTLGVYQGEGRVVFSGDITPLFPAYYPEGLRDEEELLLQNIANWLANLNPNATEASSWGSLKSLYAPR